MTFFPGTCVCVCISSSTLYGCPRCFNFKSIDKKSCEISRSVSWCFRLVLSTHKLMLKHKKIISTEHEFMLSNHYSHIFRNSQSHIDAADNTTIQFHIVIYRERQIYNLYWSFLLANYGSEHTFHTKPVWICMADEP